MNSGAGKRSLFVDAHPELDAAQADAILNGQIMVGMTEEMVQASWGKPSRTEMSRSDDLGTPTSHWVYGNVFTSGTITDLYFNEAGQLVRYEVNSHEGSGNGGRVMTAEETSKGPASGHDALSKDGGSAP